MKLTKEKNDLPKRPRKKEIQGGVELSAQHLELLVEKEYIK